MDMVRRMKRSGWGGFTKDVSADIAGCEYELIAYLCMQLALDFTC
jgi:hypothetical protein